MHGKEKKRGRREEIDQWCWSAHISSMQDLNLQYLIARHTCTLCSMHGVSQIEKRAETFVNVFYSFLEHQLLKALSKSWPID
jgi:hypothetical protein